MLTGLYCYQNPDSPCIPLKVSAFLMNIKVLFGTQTGTAEELARHLTRQLLHCSASVKTCHSIDKETSVSDSIFDDSFYILVISTSGLGQIPSSAINTWTRLRRRDLHSNIMSRMKYLVIGLGDKTYGGDFCRAAKLFRARLEQLGAQEVLPLLSIDTREEDIYTIIEKWFMKELIEKVGLQWNIDRLPPMVTIKMVESETNHSLNSEMPFTAGLPWNVTVTAVERMTPEDYFQDVRLVTFEIGSTASLIRPGDVAVIYPHNCPDYVNRLLQMLQRTTPDLTLSTMVTLHSNRPDAPQNLTSTPITLFDCFSQLLDLHRPPAQPILKLLSQTKFSNPLINQHGEKLQELVHDLDLYLDYVWRPKRSTLDVLDDFIDYAQEAIGLDDLFDFFFSIQPRQFSLAGMVDSSDMKKIDLCVARVKTSILKSLPPRLGLASNYLCDLIPGNKCHIDIISGTLLSPGDFAYIKGYCIFVAAGTGIAPARSLIQAHPNRRSHCWLIQGCRYMERDSLFYNELSQCLDYYTIAGSRDKENKIYVQHLIRENSQQLIQWVKEFRATIYLTGSTRLSSPVREALDGILGKGTYVLREETW